jgi:hypothetical protein
MKWKLFLCVKGMKNPPEAAARNPKIGREELTVFQEEEEEVKPTT